MVFEFKLPDLGEGVAEGEVLAWHVAPGDAVAEDDVLAEVETDKAAVDVPSPVEGVVGELRYDVGDVVEVGEVLITIETDGDGAEPEAAGPEATGAGGAEAEGDEGAEEETATAETETTGEATSSAKGGRVFAAPNVRRLARELGVDVASVAGSGPSGRVTEADVRAAAEAETGSAEADEGSREGDADGSETGLKSAVSRVGDDEAAETGEAAEEPTVKSAVRKVGAGDGAVRREQTLATPATRKLARDLDVDIDAVPTDETRDGEAYVTEAAVRAFAEREAAPTEAEPAAAGADEATQQVVEAPKPTRREPYRGVRRTIGERMAESRRTVPDATHYDQAVVPELVAAKERLEPLAEERNVRLTYLPFVLKCVVAALREHPVLNTELDEANEEIVYKDYYDIGVATATDAGLVVPVVEAVDEKGILELASDVNDLVSRARDRSIDREELQGGTFTVTNFGAIGGEYADPVINVPQTAILGVGALRERPVVEDGEVVARPTLPFTVAIDHRVIDGADAARFANTLKEYLADPTLLLLE